MLIAPDGGFGLAVARSCAVAAVLSAFGSLLFGWAVLPKVLALHPDAAASDGTVRLLARWSLAVALATLLAWGVLQTAEFAHSGTDLTALATAWPVVLLHTVFGHLLLAQLMAVVAGGLLLPRRPRAALALTAAAVLLQAGHSHAASMYDGPSVLLGANMLHLLAAGAWLGGLVPLLIVVRDGSPRAGASAARWFSPLGKWCVAGVVASAAIQFWVLIGGLPGLIGTPYGLMAIGKLALLIVLLGFAVLNRYRLAPALIRAGPVLGRRRLVRSIAVQTGFGIATVLAAGLLSNLPPALHEQPVWPFAWRPSLEAMAEPELAAEVWRGALLALGGVVLLASLAWSRLRRIAAAAPIVLGAVTLTWLAWPHLSLLLVEAYPTSYYASPTGFAANSIMQGTALYPTHCASCHGATGGGDGPAAGLAIPPADLTAGHLWAHSDGELFWWLSRGIEAPDGSLVMPGFAAVLNADQRWTLIDAIRARNAGTAFRETGAWPVPLQLPDFNLDCPTGQTSTSALRGHALYVAIGPATAVSVRVARGETCPASDPAARGAIAILLGQTAESVAGARLLVDQNGWLRAAKTAAVATEWDDPAKLTAAIDAIVAAPLSASASGHHHGG